MRWWWGMVIGYGAQWLVDTASWTQILDNRQTCQHKYLITNIHVKNILSFFLRPTPHVYYQLGGWVPIQYIGCKQLSIWRVCFCMKILFASWVGLVPIQYIGDKCKQLVIGGVYTEWWVIPVYNHNICQLYVAKFEILGTNASNWGSVHRVEDHHNTPSATTSLRQPCFSDTKYSNLSALCCKL